MVTPGKPLHRPLTFFKAMALLTHATETDLSIEEPFIAPMGQAKAEPMTPELKEKLRQLAAQSGVKLKLPVFPKFDFDVPRNLPLAGHAQKLRSSTSTVIDAMRAYRNARDRNPS